MLKIVVFDLETRLDANDLSPHDERLGWDRLRDGEGGISSLIIYDYSQDWPYMYDDKSIDAAVAHLEYADLVVGYFSTKFDIPVIEGIIGRKLILKHHYDIYTEIAQASAKRGQVGRKGDFTLDTVGRRCFGVGKTSSGKLVSKLVRDGRLGEVFNYCGNDVKLTRDIFNHICLHKGIQGLNNSWLPLKIPDWIREATREQ